MGTQTHSNAPHVAELRYNVEQDARTDTVLYAVSAQKSTLFLGQFCAFLKLQEELMEGERS